MKALIEAGIALLIVWLFLNYKKGAATAALIPAAAASPFAENPGAPGSPFENAIAPATGAAPVPGNASPCSRCGTTLPVAPGVFGPVVTPIVFGPTQPPRVYQPAPAPATFQPVSTVATNPIVQNKILNSLYGPYIG